YLTEAEKSQLLFEFNDTKVDYPTDKTIVDLFEEQVLRTPDHTAVVFEGKSLTYRELNEKSNQLAYYLRETYDIQSDDLVGIKLDRSELMITAILGTLKSGGAYVPIDVNYPEDRIAYIEKDSNCKVVLDQEEIISFNLERFRYGKSNLSKSGTPKDLAYIIYTSGTTGNPKGVMIEHHSLFNYLQWCSEFYFDKQEEGNFGVFSSLSFDLTVTSIYLPLIRGNKIKIISNDLSSDEVLADYISNASELDSIKLTPSHLELLKDLELKESPLQKIVVGGESLLKKQVEGIFQQNRALTIYNEYGPTESTVGCIVKRITDENLITIGKPIANTQIYILDDLLALVPAGVPGKLYISGAGLARGYLNREDLTAEKFISNPFIAGQRMYDTGDLASWLADGDMVFLGRKDSQVKIRGFRIELGEIESVILAYFDTIIQAVVEAKTINEDKVLVAYLVSKSVDKSALRDFLESRLPDYMIPSFFVELDVIPLTPNGKADRKALPDVSGGDIIRNEYVLPRNETEQKLVSIWEEVLGIAQIGITDNFFELGGHSLIVAQVINRIYKQLGKTLSFKVFFANPTIGELTQYLKDITYFAIPKAPELVSYPLSASQTRMWILNQLNDTSLAYNISTGLRIYGIIDFYKFEKSLRFLINRHEILRTYFKVNENGEVRQNIISADDLNFRIVNEDFSLIEDYEMYLSNYLTEKNRSSFDLEQAPLIQSFLIKLREEEYVFFLSMHHIIADGWSLQILMLEFIKVYNKFISEKEVNLPELNIQYKDYAVWLTDELQEKKQQESAQYWINQFSGELPIFDLPSSKIRPIVKTNNGATIQHEFSKSFLDKLKYFSKSQDATLFMTLISGINAMLYRYSGQSDIIIGTPVAGREHPDLENQLGLYLNTLAIRTRFKEKNSFSDLIAAERETLLGAYEHQGYPFDELVGKLNLTRDMSRSALFDVMIVLQNQEQLNNFKTDELLSFKVENYDFKTNTSKVDLNFNFTETNGLELSISYNTDIYDEFTVARMFCHFENLLINLINEPEKNIEEIGYLSETEKNQLLFDFNDTNTDYPTDKTVIDLFEKQVERTPNNIAVVFDNKELTYNEINKISNQLAHYLRGTYDIKPNDLIGIKLERSELMIIAVLGVLKSGAAYVPIDINYPEQRISYIEKKSNSKAIIDAEEFSLFITLQNNYSDENIAKINVSDDLSYVIYTSGTTGNPKGVMIENGNLVNYIISQTNLFDIRETENILQSTNFSFDASVEQIFLALLNGARLSILSTEILLDSKKMGMFLERNKITHLHSTPSVLNNIILQNWTSLKRVLSGGDSCSVKLANKFSNHCSFYNKYGPTETTVSSTILLYDERKYFSIGKPVANTQIYIL
ncbi:amino acid adenylation domain-containing protein, partial [Flavobacterium sp. ZT3R18]|uniref:non-ribosomal peptide synthetase n=1 Tax=Flavobacterium sp. ZT3R18 TaxID=2594429 RepID=UPI00117BC527